MPHNKLHSDEHLAAGPDPFEYVHDQSTPGSVWTIVHNLGRWPSVVVVDSGGTTVIGEVNYVDGNTLTITFTSSFAGKAYVG